MPEPDHYLIQFLLIGLPILLVMLGLGIASLRKRSRAGALILGAVFILTAYRLVRDGQHRTAPRDQLIVQSVGIASGVGGLLLIVLGFRFPAAMPGPPPSGRAGS